MDMGSFMLDYVFGTSVISLVPYVAINNHYHKYAQLFKAWFGDNIDTKIFEAAIVFWFKDDEFPENEKLWKFFQMK